MNASIIDWGEDYVKVYGPEPDAKTGPLSAVQTYSHLALRKQRQELYEMAASADNLSPVLQLAIKEEIKKIDEQIGEPKRI